MGKSKDELLRQQQAEPAPDADADAEQMTASKKENRS